MSNEDIAMVEELRNLLPPAYCDSAAGSRIATLRRQQFPSRRKLTRRFPHIKERALQQIENNCRPPAMHELKLMALVLETSFEYLAWGRGSKQLRPQERRDTLIDLGVGRTKAFRLYQAEVMGKTGRK
jgi:hypothetical protein